MLILKILWDYKDSRMEYFVKKKIRKFGMSTSNEIKVQLLKIRLYNNFNNTAIGKNENYDIATKAIIISTKMFSQCTCFQGLLVSAALC